MLPLEARGLQKRWELRKLVSQKRTYIGIGAAAVLPILFVVVMAFQVVVRSTI